MSYMGFWEQDLWGGMKGETALWQECMIRSAFRTVSREEPVHRRAERKGRGVKGCLSQEARK